MRMINAATEIKTLKKHIETVFKRRNNTTYRLWVVYDRFNKSINFFMLIQAKTKRPHSIPLHMVPTLDLAILEAILSELNESFQLPVIFINFEGLRFPKSNHLIQPPEPTNAN